MKGLRTLETSVNDPQLAERLGNLGQELGEQLVGLYLRRHHPRLFRAAALLTLVDSLEQGVPAQPTANGGGPARAAWRRDSLRFDRVGALIQDPWTTLAGAYFPNGLATASDAHAAAARLFPVLGGLAATVGVPWSYDKLPAEPEPPRPDDPVDLAESDHFEPGDEQPPETWRTPAPHAGRAERARPALLPPPAPHGAPARRKRLGRRIAARGRRSGVVGRASRRRRRAARRARRHARLDGDARRLAAHRRERRPDAGVRGRPDGSRARAGRDVAARRDGATDGRAGHRGGGRPGVCLRQPDRNPPGARRGARRRAARAERGRALGGRDGRSHEGCVRRRPRRRRRLPAACAARRRPARRVRLRRRPLEHARRLLQGRGGLDATLPVEADLLGVVRIDAVHLGLRARDDRITGEISTTAP